MIKDPINLAGNRKENLFWTYEEPIDGELVTGIGLFYNEFELEWAIFRRNHRTTYNYGIKGMIRFTTKTVTRGEFIQNLQDNYPDHFEWFLWNLEWLGNSI